MTATGTPRPLSGSSALVSLHLAVMLFGLSGLFGKYLTLPPLVIVCGRTFFAAIGLAGILTLRRQAVKLHTFHDAFILVLMGILLALHWLSSWCDGLFPIPPAFNNWVFRPACFPGSSAVSPPCA